MDRYPLDSYPAVTTITIATIDRRLARVLEPGAPRPDLRFKAISQLVADGVAVEVRIDPVLPGINDHPELLDRLVAAAARSGAASLAASPVLPMPSALVRAFPSLEAEFPDLVDRYRERYEGSAQLPEPYRAALAALLGRLCRQHGMVVHRGVRKNRLSAPEDHPGAPEDRPAGRKHQPVAPRTQLSLL